MYFNELLVFNGISQLHRMDQPMLGVKNFNYIAIFFVFVNNSSDFIIITLIVYNYYFVIWRLYSILTLTIIQSALHQNIYSNWTIIAYTICSILSFYLYFATNFEGTGGQVSHCWWRDLLNFQRTNSYSLHTTLYDLLKLWFPWLKVYVDKTA